MKPIILFDQSGCAQMLLLSLYKEQMRCEFGKAIFTKVDIVKLTMFKDEAEAEKNIQELIKNLFLENHKDGLFILTDGGITEGKKIRGYDLSMTWSDV